MLDAPPFEEAAGDSDAEEEYKPEAILDERGQGRTARYLVKWFGYPKSESTWEPKRNIASCFKVLYDSWSKTTSKVHKEPKQSKPKQSKSQQSNKRKANEYDSSNHKRALGKRVCRSMNTS